MAKEIYEAPLTRTDKIIALEALYREVRETGESQGNIQDMIEALRRGEDPKPEVLAAEDLDPPAPPPANEPDDDEDEAWPASPEYPQDPAEGTQWVHHVFEEIFPSRLPGYEARQPQIDLAEAIARALATGEHLVSEAGTGTGKSLAYLVPSIWFGKKAGRPVVVTTGTKALQEQLHQKDVPFLQRTLTELPFRAALVKGKGNYLCLSRLEDELKQPNFFGNPELDRIRNWSRDTMTGDMAELPYIPPADVWGQVNVDDTCNKRDCPFYHKCFFFEAKRQWAEADILICNHHLFFADLAIRGSSAGGSGILPQYSATVFDEAHHIEPVASDSFGVEITPFKVPSIVKDLRKLRHPDMPDHLLRQLEDASRTVFERPLYVDPPINKADFRRLPELTQEQLNVELAALAKMLIDVDGALGGLTWNSSDSKSQEKCQRYRERLLRLEEALQALIAPDDGYVNWIEVERPAGKPPKVILHNSPISVAEDLRLAIWDRSWATVSTSATISTGGNFRYFRSQVGLDKTSKAVKELLVDSPFDYRTQARLYIPRGLPEPKLENEEAYQAAIIPEIRDTLQATGGRAFVLFTSYKGLTAAYDTLVGELTAAGYVVMKQGDLPRTQLVQQFKDVHAAGKSPVLFATGTFWEGIDIQGEALSAVIIDKIPFARPDDPVTLAKLEAIRARGGNEFMEWSVPEAAIKLKQGVGRLIRTRTDRGLVVILDPRLRTKPYGRVFLNSMPPMPEVAYLYGLAEFMKGGQS
jgi:ATP-dependent DNA helicase DinG